MQCLCVSYVKLHAFKELPNCSTYDVRELLQSDSINLKFFKT